MAQFHEVSQGIICALKPETRIRRRLVAQKWPDSLVGRTRLHRHFLDG
jgi:hypothetical protein